MNYNKDKNLLMFVLASSTFDLECFYIMGTLYSHMSSQSHALYFPAMYQVVAPCNGVFTLNRTNLKCFCEETILLVLNGWVHKPAALSHPLLAFLSSFCRSACFGSS